jgi:hypothetical protein
MLFFTAVIITHPKKNAFHLHFIFVIKIKFILQDAANAKLKVSRYGRTLFFSLILPHIQKLHGKGNLVSK